MTRKQRDYVWDGVWLGAVMFIVFVFLRFWFG